MLQKHIQQLFLNELQKIDFFNVRTRVYEDGVMDTFLFEQSETDGTKMVVIDKITAFGLNSTSKTEATVWVDVGTYTYSKDMPYQQAVEWVQELNKIVQTA